MNEYARSFAQMERNGAKVAVTVTKEVPKEPSSKNTERGVEPPGGIRGACILLYLATKRDKY